MATLQSLWEKTSKDKLLKALDCAEEELPLPEEVFLRALVLSLESDGTVQSYTNEVSAPWHSHTCGAKECSVAVECNKLVCQRPIFCWAHTPSQEIVIVPVEQRCRIPDCPNRFDDEFFPVCRLHRHLRASIQE
jgi:hypothetical protein